MRMPNSQVKVAPSQSDLQKRTDEQPNFDSLDDIQLGAKQEKKRDRSESMFEFIDDDLNSKPVNLTITQDTHAPKTSKTTEMFEDLGKKEGGDDRLNLTTVDPNRQTYASQSRTQSMAVSSTTPSMKKPKGVTCPSIIPGAIVEHYPGYNPEGPGDFECQKSYSKNELTTSYNVRSCKQVFDHFEYRLIGTDPKTKKIFDVMRRFNHFVLLRASFMLKFPGMYIPPLPKKTMSSGLAENSTTRLRTYFLNRFIKQVALCPYLLESQEFQVFLKPVLNLEKELTQMLNSYTAKQTAWHID